MCVLDEWIKGNYESDDEDMYPCWCSVVYVIANDLGGRHPAVATEVAESWQGWSNRSQESACSTYVSNTLHSLCRDMSFISTNYKLYLLLEILASDSWLVHISWFHGDC